jgi:LuxR family maltose regulon positive regulatory protein
MALGRWERAAATAATLVEFDSDPLALERVVHAHALRARLALLRGDLDSAQRWLLGSDLDPFPLVPLPLLEVAAVTRIQVLLTLGTRAGALQALELARQLQRDAASISSTLRLAQALVLQALALDALKDERQALGALKQAIELAQPGRLIRLFIDFGPALGGLLQRLLKSGGVTRQDTADYAAQLLNAFPVTPGALPVRLQSGTGDRLIEPLTEREVQVLELLALRLTDREIADTLVISPYTVRRHFDNISQKLGARGRRALVERALSLELIPSDPPNSPKWSFSDHVPLRF